MPLQIQREWLEELVFGGEASRRFTQDSPVLPDVWLEFGVLYAADPRRATMDLLLTPHREAGAAALFNALHGGLKAERTREDWNRRRGRTAARPAELAFNQSAVVARLHFDELVRVVLPLSRWAWDLLFPVRDPERRRSPLELGPAELAEEIRNSKVGRGASRERIPESAAWLVRLIGVVHAAAQAQPTASDRRRGNEGVFREILSDETRQAESFAQLAAGIEPPVSRGPATLWMVSRNRPAVTTVSRSALSVKADAARLLFSLRCDALAWAVIDSGIDATHPAFRRSGPDGQRYADPMGGHSADPPRTRVVATYDFTRIRYLLAPEVDRSWDMHAELVGRAGRSRGNRRALLLREASFWERVAEDSRTAESRARELHSALASGRSFDWETIAPLIEVPHDGGYVVPDHEHGTHVAGILAGDWRAADWRDSAESPTDGDMVGVCPDLRLYDFRVLDRNGSGDEFAVMAALQYLRHLNANREQPIIHGANLSLAIKHDVANYACGRTPVCEEAERLVASGVVVVAAAGNDGYQQFTAASTGGLSRSFEGYRNISIADPGNAEGVITVGATHRFAPHTYGVSYFSSRGPTADGRMKPDVVAPGEKILGPVPGGAARVKDGTSMAAPHVSGVAALLLARHQELLARPNQIKQILLRTATDLGRERYFQGAGMVDALRALQSV